jgi:hypothetical protein
MGVGGESHAPAALPPGMTQYPLCRTLGRPQGRSGRVLKIFPPPGFDSRTVQLVAHEVEFSLKSSWPLMFRRARHRFLSCDYNIIRVYTLLQALVTHFSEQCVEIDTYEQGVNISR